MDNTWLGGSYQRGLASDPRNWSLGHVPTIDDTSVLSYGSMRDYSPFGMGILWVGNEPPHTTPSLSLYSTSLYINFIPNQNSNLSLVINGTCHLDLHDPYSTSNANNNVAVWGADNSHLYLQSTLTFGSYTEHGGTLIPHSGVFVANNVLLDCDLDNVGYQLAMYSGGRMEIDGKVQHGLEVIMSGTSDKATQLYIDKYRPFNGVLAFNGNGFADFKDLHDISSYKIIHGDFINHTATEAIQLLRGRSVVATEYIAPADQNLKVATGKGGLFIYDATNAEMAGFHLTKLPMQH